MEWLNEYAEDVEYRKYYASSEATMNKIEQLTVLN